METTITKLTELEHLRIQLAYEKALRCEVQAQIATALAKETANTFEQLKGTLIKSYNIDVAAGEVINIDNGNITRKTPTKDK
jgi:hypothetical protein